MQNKYGRGPKIGSFLICLLEPCETILVLYENQFSTKELSFSHNLEFSNPYIFSTGWRKPLIFQTYMIWSNRNRSLKYLRSMSLGCKDIEIRKSKFVAKTQFLYAYLTFQNKSPNAHCNRTITLFGRLLIKSTSNCKLCFWKKYFHFFKICFFLFQEGK